MKQLLFALAFAALFMGCQGTLVDRSLIEAVENGDLKQVRQLLDSGANVNVEDYAAHTPLYYAAEKGHLEIARLLIENGADVDHESGDSPLLWACYYGHTDMVKLLVENGADVNAKRLSDNSTPLRSASIWGGKKEIVELLLEKGVEVNVVHADGDTALDRAKPEIAEILRKHGAKTGEELNAKPWNWEELEATAKELAGSYEWIPDKEGMGAEIREMTLLENGVVEYRVGEKTSPAGKWKLKYLSEVHVVNEAGRTEVYTVADDKTLLKVAYIVDNHRKGQIRQVWRKLK